MGNETNIEGQAAPTTKKPGIDASANNRKADVPLNQIADPLKLMQEGYGGACSASPAGFNTNPKFDDAFWTAKFSDQLCTQSAATLDGVFDEKGDSAKLKAYKPADDQQVKSILAAHKKGDHWTANGTNYYVDSSGDLIEKDQKGIHFFGADGTRYDGNRKEGVLTHNGETVVRKGNEYFKKYPDGQEVQITEKQDIEALVKIDGLIFEQRRTALQQMNADGLADAARRGSRIVTGTDGVAVYKVDADGDVIAKNSHDHGAYVRLKNGEMYQIRDGKVYKMGGQGQSPQEMTEADLPPQIKRGPDGSITVGTVTIEKGDKYHDREHNIQMSDQANRVTAATSQGEVTAHVDNGKETIDSSSRSYTYDPSGGGKYCVRNSNGTDDLTFDNFTGALTTDGATFTPDGCQINDITMGNDGSVSDDILSIINADDNVQDDVAVASSTEEAVGAQVIDSETDISNALADVGKSDANFGDLSELEADLTDLDMVGSSTRMTDGAIAKINYEKGAVHSAIAALSLVTQASRNTTQMAGVENSDLTKEVVEQGGDANATAIVLRRHGLAPAQLPEEQSQSA
jgi:hypothetical protein